MGKDRGSWMHQQCPPHQAPNLNCTSFVPNSAWANASPDCPNPTTRLGSKETISGNTGYKLPQFKAGLANGPQGWFYGLPRYRQALTPNPDCTPKKFNACPEGNNKNATLNAVSKPMEKKFLVFDHSGNQTRLVYSPDTAYPNYCSNVVNPRTFDNGGNLPIGEWRSKTGPSYGDQETGEESEMREDTEELNALLYSDEDDEYDCGCEEEISTGHSPSKMRGGIKADDNAREEVASSGGGSHLKRKRLVDEECGASSLVDTASSGKLNGWSEYEDDAESSSTHGGGESGPFPVINKRLKREKIRETVEILQDIIPGGKGKDAMYVLDEAIQYLRSLKLKAKSFGESLEL